MPLFDFTPESQTIELAGKPVISVRGLNLTDVSLIVRFNLANLETLFALYDQHKDHIFVDQLARDQFIFQLVKDMPDLMHSVIAMAADAPAQVGQIAGLPLGVQLEAFAALLNLTFQESGGPKNFLATLQTLLGTMLMDGSLKTPKAA